MPTVLPPDVHRRLDEELPSYFHKINTQVPREAADKLELLLLRCRDAYKTTWPVDLHAATQSLLESRADIHRLLQNCEKQGAYAEVRELPEFHIDVYAEDVGDWKDEKRHRSAGDSLDNGAWLFGNGRDNPVTTKISENGGNALIFYEVTEMMGWRPTMEDAHRVILNLQEGNGESPSFFAVYDGHTGDIVVKFVADNLHKWLINDEVYKDKQYGTALKRAFLGTDEDLRASPESSQMDHCGTTALAALMSDGKLYIANAGDSRAVISVRGVAKQITIDHRPSNEIEKARIYGAGGYIVDDRVDSDDAKMRLSPSRALGDFKFKLNHDITPENQIVTADPDIFTHEISETDEFLVLACDGIWDCMSSQAVVDFIRLEVARGKDLSEIGGMVCDKCLAPNSRAQYETGIGSDNMTIIIIAILNGRTKDEWHSWILEDVPESDEEEEYSD